MLTSARYVYTDAQRFDHHQRGFGEVFGHGFNTKLSSAGLVYKHFGEEIVAGIMGKPVSDPAVRTVYLAVYRQFMEAIDAIDNGISQYDAAGPPRYASRTDLSSRVGGLNPRWNQPASDADLDARFQRAVAMTGAEFLESVDYISQCWLPARSIVEAALAARHEVDASGEIMELTTGGCPWKEHLYALEKEQAVKAPIKYCLYQDNEKKWRIQAVPASASSFESRKPLPAAWRGLRDQALSDATGVPDCVFVHAAGFIGGHATHEGAVELARKALTQ